MTCTYLLVVTFTYINKLVPEIVVFPNLGGGGGGVGNEQSSHPASIILVTFDHYINHGFPSSFDLYKTLL